MRWRGSRAKKRLGDRGHNALLPFAIVIAVSLAGCSRQDTGNAERTNAGNVDKGRQIVVRLDCGVCHTIPGVAGADGTVGPSLAGFGRRNLIGGVLPNQAAQLARFVRDAPSLVPDTAMPAMPMTEDEALDVAAFLLSLR